MSRYQLSHPSQPLPLRWLLRLYEFFASLKLAVVLIFSLAMVLAFATFVESNLGTKAAQWYVYHSRAFAGLLILLAANIFCAAAIRFPPTCRVTRGLMTWLYYDHFVRYVGDGPVS